MRLLLAAPAAAARAGATSVALLSLFCGCFVAHFRSCFGSAALVASCSTDKAKAHSPFASKSCAVCAGKEQHVLRVAGCTADEIQDYCRSLPSGA